MSLPLTNQAVMQFKRTTKEMLNAPGLRNDFLLKLIPRDQLEAFTAAVLSGIWSKPELMEADPKSIVSAVVQCAHLGLAPCTRDEHAHLVIYRNKGVPVLTLVIGFKGLIHCAKRAGFTVNANVVREGDVFSMAFGFSDEITHKIDITKERGEMIAVYAAISRGEERHVAIMTKREVEAYRDRFSQGLKYKDGSPNLKSPWNTHFEAMALKTVIKKGLRRLDLSTGFRTNPLQDAIRVDGAQMAKYTPDDVLQGIVDVGDIDGEVIDYQEEPETKEPSTDPRVVDVRARVAREPQSQPLAQPQKPDGFPFSPGQRVTIEFVGGDPAVTGAVETTNWENNEISVTTSPGALPVVIPMKDIDLEKTVITQPSPGGRRTVK